MTVAVLIMASDERFEDLKTCKEADLSIATHQINFDMFKG